MDMYIIIFNMEESIMKFVCFFFHFSIYISISLLFNSVIDGDTNKQCNAFG